MKKGSQSVGDESRKGRVKLPGSNQEHSCNRGDNEMPLDRGISRDRRESARGKISRQKGFLGPSLQVRATCFERFELLIEYVQKLVEVWLAACSLPLECIRRDVPVMPCERAVRASRIISTSGIFESPGKKVPKRRGPGTALARMAFEENRKVREVSQSFRRFFGSVVGIASRPIFPSIPLLVD